MRRKKRGIAVVLAAALLAFSLEASALTHLNQFSAKYHVTLKGQYNGQLQCYEFFRVLDSGVVEPQQFEVPSSFYLVITDFEWRLYWGGEPYERISLFIYLHGPNGASDKICFSSAVLTINGRGGGCLNLVSGFVAAPGSRLTVPTTKSVTTMFVRGYITPTPQ